MMNHRCGTPTYIAPEVLRGKSYSFNADIFGVGSMMFNLATGRYLFVGKTTQELINKNKECNLSELH